MVARTRMRAPSLDLAAPMSLGCIGCSALADCGGMFSPSGGWGCAERWADPLLEPDVLRLSDPDFPQRVAEVGGFGFGDLGSIESPVELPPYISGVDHGTYFTNIRDTKQLRWAAVHLRKIFSFGRGWAPRFSGPADLRRELGIPAQTRLVLSCIDQDQFIEPMWAYLFDRGFSSYIRSLGFEAVIAPNFSVFNRETPSQHHLNRKRSAIVAEELSRFRVPVVLYCHGNGPADWDFWREVLISRPDIRFIAKEFQTGLASPARGRACIRALATLQEAVGRPLHLVAIGPIQHRRYIAERFQSWTVISFNPFVLATKRRVLVTAGTGFRQQKSNERPGRIFAQSDRLLWDDCMRLYTANRAKLSTTRLLHSPAATTATVPPPPPSSARCTPTQPDDDRRVRR